MEVWLKLLVNIGNSCLTLKSIYTAEKRRTVSSAQHRQYWDVLWIHNALITEVIKERAKWNGRPWGCLILRSHCLILQSIYLIFQNNSLRQTYTCLIIFICLSLSPLSKVRAEKLLRQIIRHSTSPFHCCVKVFEELLSLFAFLAFFARLLKWTWLPAGFPTNPANTPHRWGKVSTSDAKDLKESCLFPPACRLSGDAPPRPITNPSQKLKGSDAGVFSEH